MIRLLLVCLDDQTRLFLLKHLSNKEYVFSVANSHKKAWEILKQKECDVIVAGHKLPRTSALDFVKEISKKSLLPVIVISGQPEVKDATQAIRNGACDFLVLPLRPVELKKAIIQALRAKKMMLENIRLKKTFMENKSNLIGTSSAMQRVREQILQVAPTKSTVLIIGESGTGKELIAESIYNLSPRVGKPFVKVNCGALPESLLESELFGHEKGAFTGALSKRKGRFELADSGTIFLDEIGEMPLSMQVKLLRVLEAGEFERVGGENTIKVNVRVIAATNKNLEEEVKAGRFRADLYYRLNVFVIEVPPLRDRQEDVLLLAHYFLHQFARESKKDVKGFTPEVEKAFLSYNWPGNVRELKHVIERAVILARSPYVGMDSLPPKLHTVAEPSAFITLPLGLKMEQIEKIIIEKTLTYTKGNKQAAAEMLGISLATLYRRLKEM